MKISQRHPWVLTAEAAIPIQQQLRQDRAIARRPTTFPYIPGFLSFREVPAALDALAQLTHMPDLILCDGQGIAI